MLIYTHHWELMKWVLGGGTLMAFIITLWSETLWVTITRLWQHHSCSGCACLAGTGITLPLKCYCVIVQSLMHFGSVWKFLQRKFSVLSCQFWSGYILLWYSYSDVMPGHQHHKKHHGGRKRATPSGNVESDDRMSNGSENGDRVSETGDQESEVGNHVEHAQPPSPLAYEALRDRSPSPQFSGLFYMVMEYHSYISCSGQSKVHVLLSLIQ